MLPRQSEATDAEPARLWPADRVERWPFERLIPYANNPRSHSEADLDKIAAPVRKWGRTTAGARRMKGAMISGHAAIAKMTTGVQNALQNAYYVICQADEEDGSITVIRDSAGSITWSQPVSPGFQDKVISQMFEKSHFDHTMHPWPADRVERWALDRLIPYANNPRLHSEADLDKIAAAIRKWGWTMPVLADEDGGLISGHARVGAATKLGLASIPVIVARGWSEEEKRAYRIADNQLAARASWDMEQLGNELRDLQFAGLDLGLIGFEPDQLETLLAGLGSSGLTDPDSVPEVPEQPVTRPGDVWLLGAHRVGCGDSTSKADVERVLTGSEPHLMVADPPYGVRYDPSWRARCGLGSGNLAQGPVLNDDRAEWRSAYALFPGDVAYVWHGALHGDVVAADLAACGLQLRAQLVWAKQHFTLGRGDYHWKHETCWYAVREGKSSQWQGDRRQATVWEIPNNNPFGNREREPSWGHGTQKPVECMRRPIENNSRAGQAVYDPFLGSGTTLIAAEITGRICYGLELSPAYVDVVVQRWQLFTGRSGTHEASGQSFDERAQTQHPEHSGAAHGEKSLCRG